MIIWKKIKDFPDYEVSNDGKVRFLGGWRQFGTQKRYVSAGERTPQPHSGGYLQLVLRYEQKKSYNRYIHRLVAETFLENPNNFREVNHKDGNKQNNLV